MTQQHMQALFLLAGIEVVQYWELANQYWPNTPDYHDLRKANPWWLVKTKYGMISIGRRKRVISIDWSDTGIHVNGPFLTTDAVTVDHTIVHAWSHHKAVEYLSELRRRFDVILDKQEQSKEATPVVAAIVGSGVCDNIS